MATPSHRPMHDDDHCDDAYDDDNDEDDVDENDGDDGDDDDVNMIMLMRFLSLISRILANQLSD
jgi:hypothetical protein